MRPEAYEGDGIRETLAPPPSSSSPASGTAASTATERRSSSRASSRCTPRTSPATPARPRSTGAACCASSPSTPGCRSSTIADYEVVYNVYDWGLTTRTAPRASRPILFHEPVEAFHEGDTELRELHLYEGNFCNRTCSWCTIDGSPEGWYGATRPRVLDEALASLAPDGNIKFYGGEPTLHADGLIEAMRYLRARGFRGLFTIFSNGVKARALIAILESDPRSEAVLNYSIYHGPRRRAAAGARQGAARGMGRAQPPAVPGLQGALPRRRRGGQAFDRDREAASTRGTGCVRCFPVLTSTGEFHACPFAAEIDAPHYDLGACRHRRRRSFANYRRFRAGSTTCSIPPRARGASRAARCATAT